MSTIGDIIQYNLLLDTVDSTALDVYNLDPSLFPGGVGTVPPYLYQSLPTLLSIPASSLHNRIVPNLGEALTGTSPGLVIQNTMEYESILVNHGARSNQPGARNSTIHIGIRNLVTDKHFNKIDNIAQRLVYLLDGVVRENRVNHVTMDLIVPDSATGLYRYPFKVRFNKAFINTASEVVTEWYVDYYRIFI